MDLPEIARQELIKLLPSSILNEVACFVFYDNHPSHEKNIDLTVCTNNGQLKEFFQRDLVYSLNLHFSSKPTDIRILRNCDSELFYLVSTKDELYIISSKDQLQIHKKLTNIEKYDVSDTDCSGKACLKVIKKDDAVPILFDDNFESLDVQSIFASTQNDHNSFPILTELKRKLVEARYNTKCNEKTYSQYLSLRQKASLHSYQKIHPNAKDSTYKDGLNIAFGALKLKTQKPWVKVCNMKIVIMLNVTSNCEEPLENIHILLNTMATSSLVFTTKIFSKLQRSPYWEETHSQKLKSNQEYAIVALMDITELKLSVSSKIELSGSISYKMYGKEYILPFEDVVISALESMGDEFDVLSNSESTDRNTILAVLASTEKTELILRHITQDDELNISLLDLFHTHLNMERVGDTNNVIVYRKSPYHVLNGTMIVFHGDPMEKAVAVSVYTRTPSQVLALLHCIYDAVPAKIIATTPAYKITAKTEELASYNEEIANTPKETNFMDYATTILNRSTKILEHLDKSMIRMSESKNPEVRNKIGSSIDLFAGGVEDFTAFKLSLMEEARKGIDSLVNIDSTY